MRIAEDDPRAHRHELVDEEQPVLEHLLEDQDGAPRLRRDRQRDRRQVGREPGPGAVLDLRDLGAQVVADHELLPGRDAHGRPLDLVADAEPLEAGPDRDEVLGLDVLDHELPVGDGAEADEARDLDVVGADPPLTAVQALDAADAQHVRADPLDVGAERAQEPAEILHVRLAGGVRDDGLAAGEHGRHDGVLGAGDGRLVEEDRGAAKPGGLHRVAALDGHGRAELLERVHVRVEAAAADHVPAGRGHDRAAAAGEQRPGEQDRGADPAAELLVELVSRSLGGVDAHLARPEALHVDAEPLDELEHRVDVEDRRDVRERHRRVREQAGRDDRQRRVLVAGGPDAAVQRLAALDHERLHQRLRGEGVRQR